MNEKAVQDLRELLRQAQVASIGTLHDSAPSVSLTPWAPAADGSALLIHVSRLAQHTGDILADPRVAAMIAEPESSGTLAQALPRVMIHGTAREIDRDSPEYEGAKDAYLARHPRSTVTFGLGDFSIFAIEPRKVRFVAGFGRAFDVDTNELAAAMLGEAGQRS